MIERQKGKYGWGFLFIGANIDAVETAARYGMDKDRAVNCNADGEDTHIFYGVNDTEEKSNNNFNDVDDLYKKLSIHTTGNIIVYARWAEISLHITQHGYTKYDTETIEGVPENSTLTQELNSLIAGD